MDQATLLARPSIERDITLTCVSNEVGGPYAGNARWIGIPLKALLEEAGVQPGADQLVSRSVDGLTAGTPTAIVMDGRDAMLAVAMNGQALPVDLARLEEGTERRIGIGEGCASWHRDDGHGPPGRSCRSTLVEPGRVRGS